MSLGAPTAPLPSTWRTDFVNNASLSDLERNPNRDWVVTVAPLVSDQSLPDAVPAGASEESLLGLRYFLKRKSLGRPLG